MSAAANLYLDSQARSNQFTLTLSFAFLLRTIQESGNLLIMPIKGANNNGRPHYLAKRRK